ncbi:8081_t:CDS:2 [Paraglomus occultum]|uniref:8081_t:CDS:1 n=1 Tax=Paraglomus occultum TaxID=144539 RepID=A0A9N9BTL1_9GLOM|nr:8081_t:CDS:2 [Paraglomus occultum]
MSVSRLGVSAISLIFTAVCFLPLTIAHEHEDLEDGAAISDDPVDGVLLAHIAAMFLAFGIIFPVGMIFGLSRSRWHVPFQITGSGLVVLGFLLGHAHGGRKFSAGNIHSAFSTIVLLILSGQVALGVYLKLHLEKGFNGLVRPVFVATHKLFGVFLPIIGYIQMVFGVITLNGWCRSDHDHTGQCLAHFIMGSSFIGYGILLLVLLKIGGGWLRSRNKSQEYYDSWVIMLWGIVNTWTEHRWNQPWTHKDLQHTALGIMWWAGGSAGIYASRGGKRNIFPALIIFFTGFAMSKHQQELMISTIIHAVFGYALMGAGVMRVIEICFVWKDDDKIRPFQYLSPYLLILSGFLFMGANEEQIAFLQEAHFDPYSYILVLISLAFLVHLFTVFLYDLYQTTGRNAKDKRYLEPRLNGRHLPLVTDRAVRTRESSGENERISRNSENYELNSLLINHMADDDE